MAEWCMPCGHARKSKQRQLQGAGMLVQLIQLLLEKGGFHFQPLDPLFQRNQTDCHPCGGQAEQSPKKW